MRRCAGTAAVAAAVEEDLEREAAAAGHGVLRGAAAAVSGAHRVVSWLQG